MAFRNPIYLDDSLLTGLADYHHLDLVGEAKIVRRTLAEREGRLGVNKGLDVGGSKGSTEEVTETYERNTRPVRNANDLIDHLLAERLLVDLVEDINLGFGARDVVQVDGDISLHAATEMGAVLAALLPDLLAAGGPVDRDDPAVKAKMINALASGEAGRDVVHVFELDSDAEVQILLVCDPKSLMPSRLWDDIEGERTVVGLVERVLAVGQSYSLERHLLPGLNRTFRRAIKGQGGLGTFLDSFGPLLGRAVSQDDVAVTGPAVLIQPLAIF